MRPALLLPAAVLVLAGCGERSAPAGDSGAPEATRDAMAAQLAEVRRETRPAQVERWQGALDELLTLEMAANAAGLPAAEAERRYRPGGATMEYRWKGPRTREYAGSPIPVADSVALGGLRTGVTPEFFRSRFAEVDAGQKEALDAELSRRVEEQGIDQASAGVARNLAAAISARNPSEPVEGIGDAAVWETRKEHQVLHVLVGDIAFELRVDISDDPAVNLAAAATLARELVARL